ncbi:MAG TPA: extracellular solute-binding protein [Clostridiaceae bacterium]|nr:extracellular solute-binding protein [Clostridiaceae bacterium]
MKMRRILAFIISACLMLSLLAGCGSNTEKEADSKADSGTGTASTSEESKTAETKPEPVTLTVFVDTVQAQDQNLRKAFDDYEKISGNKVEFNEILGPIQEVPQKRDIALMSGDTTDIIRCNAIEGINYGTAKMVEGDLKPYFEKIGFDAEKTFGDTLYKDKDGKIFGVPTIATFWAVFYNKKIFDEANVPYPKAPWTWDDYIETAKKLTDPSKGIYGSYMPLYDNMFYIKASMAGLSGYKEDGTSDYDNPLFKESMLFYHELSAVHKIQPSWAEQQIKKMTSTYFLSGKCGMMFISSWYFSAISDLETYPRDWEIGVVATPTFKDLKENKNLAICDFHGININSKNKQAAADFIAWVSTNEYKYRNQFPAMANVQKSDVEDVFKSIEESTNGQITVDDLYNAYYNNGMGVASEKILGPIASQYSAIIKAEGENFITGAKTLDQAIADIKAKADEAIEQATESNK